MSFPLDTDAQSLALDGLLGDDHAVTIPDDFELAIYNGDPRNIDSVELDVGVGGYVRVPIANDSATWPAAVDGAKVSAEVGLFTPTDVLSDTGTHWVLVSAVDHTTRWFFGLLSEPLDVDGSEIAPLSTSLAARWNTVGQLLGA